MDLQVTGTTTLKRGRGSSSSSVPPSLNQISPRVQFTRTPTSYILTVHLAGFERDEIRVVMGKTKTIMVKAQKHVDGVGEVNWTWHIMDSAKSSTTPSKKPLQVPANVDVSKMSATFQNEVLTIVMPLIEDKEEAPPSEPVPISEDQQPKKTLDKDLGSDSGVVRDGDGEEKKECLADGQERNKEIEQQQQQQQSTLSEKEKEEENENERPKEPSNQKEENEDIKDLEEQDSAKDGAANTEGDVENSKEGIEDEEEKEDIEERENAKYDAAADESANTESPKEEKEDIQHMEKLEEAKDGAANENANTESDVEKNKDKVLCDEEKQKQLCDEGKLENEHNAFVEGKEDSLASSRTAMAEDGKSIKEEWKSDWRTPEYWTSFDFKWKEHLSLERIRERIREGMSKNTRALVTCGIIFIVCVLVACYRKLRRP